MSLQFRLFGLLFVIVISCFAANLYISTKAAKQFLFEQLSAHSQDAATSLGLTLTQTAKITDKALIETTVNSLFDSGYFSKINVRNIEGEQVAIRELPPLNSSVPSWFRNYFHFSFPISHAEINDGWSQVGSVTIVSNAEHAYEQLWKLTKQSLVSALVIFLVALAIAGLLLKLVLKPLRIIQLQTEKLANKDFATIPYQPRAFEFAKLVGAYNKTVQQLALTFKQTTELADSLREQAYMDKLTGFANAASFDLKLSYELSQQTSSPYGKLIFFKIKNLSEANSAHGTQSTDQQLKAFSLQLKQSFSHLPQTSYFRISGSEFVLVIPQLDSTLKEELEAVQTATSNIILTWDDAQLTYQQGEVVSELMERATPLLQSSSKTAQQGLNASQEKAKNTGSHSMNWPSAIKKCIDQRQFSFVFQAIQGVNKEHLYFECLSRFNFPQAQDFSPFEVFLQAEKHQLIEQLDLAILEQLLARLQQEPTISASVNLSMQSFASTEFIDSALAILQKYQSHTSRLIIEIDEQAAVSQLDLLASFSQHCQILGCRITIDRVGASFASFKYIQKLKPDFIKVDGSYSQQIHNNEQQQFLFKTMLQIGHQLGAKVVAQHIETEEEYNYFKELNIDAMQGYFLDKPHTI